MPTKEPAPESDTKTRKNRGGRPPAEITRDVVVPFRTFTELRDRLDAMVILRSRPSRSSLIEYYMMKGLEADERELGVLEEHEGSIVGEPLPVFERLDARKRRRVMDLYKRAGLLAKGREGASLER